MQALRAAGTLADPTCTPASTPRTDAPKRTALSPMSVSWLEANSDDALHVVTSRDAWPCLLC